MRLASRSLWNTNSPLSGHLTQRFSGVSRRKNERILGGTTFEIQFMGGLASFHAETPDDARLAARTPSASFLTTSVVAATVEALPPPSSESRIASTTDVPTATPSACSAIAFALSAFFTPKPT